jgi:hypothetical protein
MPRASIFGGSWLNGSNAGSRYANLGNWPDNSNDNLGARGRCDDRLLGCPERDGSRSGATRRRSWSRRSSTCPVSAIAPSSEASSGRDVHGAMATKIEHRWSARQRGLQNAKRFGVPPSCFGEHTSRSGRAGRRASRLWLDASRPAAGFFFLLHGNSDMGQRYRNLIGRITAPATMQKAYRLCARGKRGSEGYLSFKEYDAFNLSLLAAEMANGSYREGEWSEFYVFDPKRRLISALPFRDRVAQQALCLVIGPIFDRALLPRCFAGRPGKGTHAGVIALQSDLRRFGRSGPVYFLKTDFSRYFASIELPILWRMIEAKISCRATLRLIETMVPRFGIGLPIGSLTSQIFANLYAGATLDRHIQQTLGESYWYRYMDDLVVLGASSEHLRAVKSSIEEFSRDTLGLRFSKWQIAPASRGVNFLGYRIWASHKLLRRDSVVRARRKIAAYRAAGEHQRLRDFLAAWLGHAGFADSANLIRSLGLQLADTRAA